MSTNPPSLPIIISTEGRGFIKSGSTLPRRHSVGVRGKSFLDNSSFGLWDMYGLGFRVGV